MRRLLRPSSHQFRRDVPAVHEQAEAAVALATAQGFPLLVAMGTIVPGWALAMQGQGEEGMATGTPGDRRLPGHRGSAARPILLHLAGGSL